MAAVADYLKANAGKAVRVEGNCDERGTEEYNRSLGERRALAVREELIRLGVPQTDVDTLKLRQRSPGRPRPRRKRLEEEPPGRLHRLDQSEQVIGQRWPARQARQAL